MEPDLRALHLISSNIFFNLPTSYIAKV